jgi:uncharacterized membrane protein
VALSCARHAAWASLRQSFRHCRHDTVRRRYRKNSDGRRGAAQPISGFPLGWAIGLSVLNEFWIAVSLAIYAVTVACWIAAFRIETRLRSLSRQAALDVVPLPEGYRRLFGAWSAFAATVLLALTVSFALMVWQPRLD